MFSISGSGNPEFRVERKLKGRDDIDALVLFKPDGNDSVSAAFHNRNGNYRNLFSERNPETVNLAWSDEDDTCDATVAGENVSEVEIRKSHLANCSLNESDI